jgi:hypothetical protein
MRMNRLRLSGLLVLATLIGGCRDEAKQGSPAAPAGQAAKAAPATAGVLVETPNLTFELPIGWQRRNPSSNMRLAEASIPGPGGAAELAVFHFGAGQGGGVDANLKRWIAQMDTDPGTIPAQGEFESNGLKVTWIDMQGTLKPSPMGMGPKEEQKGYRLIGAVAEGPGGPWFFKVTGPDATLAPRREEMLAMLRSARPK